MKREKGAVIANSFGFGKLPGALYAAWPKDEQGEPVAPKFLTHCGATDLEDAMLRNMLEAYGIPSMVIAPGDGAFGRVILGVSGTGSSIYVPETQYNEAKELMEADTDDELQS